MADLEIERKILNLAQKGMHSAIGITDSSISKVTKRTLSALGGKQWSFSHIFLYSQFSIKLEDNYRDIREGEGGDDGREEEEGDEEEGYENSDDNDERVWHEVGLIPKIHMNYSYQY